MNHTILIAALRQDYASRNLHIDLKMDWFRRGLAHPPPPPLLQRARRYVFDIHKEAITFSMEVRRYPRLLSATQRQIASTTYSHEAKAIILSLLAFFQKTAHDYWSTIPVEQMDVAVICLLRTLTDSAAFHTAIRQLILSRAILRTYAEGRVEIYKECLAFPAEAQRQLRYIVEPLQELVEAPAEFAMDLQFCIAAATIDVYMEDDIYRKLRKAVHLGRALVIRAPLLTAYYRNIRNDSTAQPYIGWLAKMLCYADTIEEVADAVAAAGIAVGPSPPDR